VGVEVVVGVDVGVEVGVDAGVDVGVEVGVDVGVEVGVEAGDEEPLPLSDFPLLHPAIKKMKKRIRTGRNFFINPFFPVQSVLPLPCILPGLPFLL
jgi:hypothetical protein